MKKIAIFIILLLANNANGQWWGSKRIKGNGNIITKTIQTKAYENITTRSIMDILLVKGKEGQIEIKAEENIIPYITIESDGNTLDIALKKGYSISCKGIIITVPFEEIKNIIGIGPGNIYCKETFTSPELEVTIKSVGSVNFSNVNATKVHLNIRSAGDINFHGQTHSSELEVTIQNSGSVNLSNVKATKVHLENRGAGKINFHGQTQSITNSLYGPGDIKLKGKTQSIEIYTRGSGDIEAFGMETNISNIKLYGRGNVNVSAKNKIEYEIHGSGNIQYKGKPKLEGRIYGSGNINKGQNGNL